MLDAIRHLALVQRFDADEAAFFARELEHIKARTYDIRYPNLRARDFVPVSGEAGPGATQVTYHQFDRVGRAKMIAPNAKDLPRVDVLGKEFPRPVRAWGDAYGWTIFEVQSAAMAGRNLNARKASAARRAIEEGLDETAAIGAPEFGIPEGFINSTAVPATTTTPWSALTADQIIAQISAAYQRIVAATLGIHRPNTIILPDEQHALIATTPRASVSDTTILEFIMRSFQTITAIEPWYRLVGAGAGATDRMIMYDRSPEILEQDITQEFTQLPVQEQGLEFVINAVAQTAGSAIYYPLAIDYTDDI
jgi:hypothetical protein